MDVRKLLKNFENQHLPHWEKPFADWVLEGFPEKLPEKPNLLELCCSNGELTAALLDRLGDRGRLIATDDVRDLLE
ncbi:MAG: hypothetical protein D6806_07365, partial [Deltaproteobacteria bacterium]